MVLTRSKAERAKGRINNDTIGYLFIAPFYIFLVVFILIPILMNLFLSFTNYDLRTLSYVGIKNYKNLIYDQHFIISLKNTFIYTFFSLLASMILGLLTAMVLKKPIFGLKFYRTSFYTPYVTSMVAISMIWLWMYDPSYGIFNQILSLFGIQAKQWLFDADLALGCIIVMSVWKILGYNMVVYISGLQAIPNYLYEAATMDGANTIQKFIHITVPMLNPVTFFLFVTGFINNFKVFEQVQIMTNGGPMNSTTTIVHQIYNRGFTEFQMGYAAAMAIFLLVIIAVVTLINFKYGNQGHDLDIG